MQLVMAAIATSPCRRSSSLPSSSLYRAGVLQRLWREPEALRRGGTRERLPELALHVAERDAVLRALRPGHGRLHVAEVEFEDARELGLRHVVRAEEALRLGVLLDQVDGLWRAVGARQEVERLLVDGEEAHRGAVLGRHVGDGRAVGEAHRGEAGAEELHELADDAVLAQHLRDRQREVRRRHALLELAGQAEADDLGHQHVDRLAQHGRLGLDPADAPAQHAQPVDHRRVAVGPDERVGVGDGQAVVAGRGPDALAMYSRLTWWQIPRSGGTTLKFSNASAPQRRNS